MALLHLLDSIRRRVNIRLDLHVVHFDHGLRGSESDGDRELVIDVCQSLYGLNDSNVHVYFWGPDSDPPQTTEGVQDKARRWRNNELARLAKAIEGSSREVVAAVAHHADDSVETILLKLLRGTSVTSLKGIDARVEVDGLVRVRPLLGLSKVELRRYLEEQELQWREDSSNQKLVYQRNKVRNVIIPAMEEIAGSPKALVERFSELDRQVRMLSRFVESEIDRGAKTLHQ